MSQRALIVDDNLEFAENLAEVLAAEGYEPIVVADALGALSRAETTEYAIGLLDVQLPWMDGLTLHARLSELHPRARYVLITGRMTGEIRERAEQAGLAVLEKPVDAATLKRALER